MTDPDEASAESASSATGRGRKRSGGTDPIVDATVAAYAAARAFLLGEWFGAALMVSSFTLLYLFAFGGAGGSLVAEVAVCVALLALGTFVYLRAKAYYERMEFDYAPKWHRTAVVVAGSAGIFWLLLVFLLVLTWFGVPVLPED